MVQKPQNGARLDDDSSIRNPRQTSLRVTGPGTLFGVPVGDLGWFASLLMGTATGFAAFFGATFLGIVGILIYNSNSQNKIDFSYSYLRVGLPVGVLVLVIALGYLGMLWVRRIARRG